MAERVPEPAAAELSIVVPAAADVASLEETLVSVLENRPAAAEVVVALGCDYADPWNIAEEVRFVRAPSGSSLTACVNLGAAAATGRVVHVLAAGWRATAGWADAALEHFARGGVAAVVPLVVAVDDPDHIVSAGIRTARSGRRIGVAATPRGRVSRPTGPLLEAGFWSADLLAACDGFATACGDWLADAEMAALLARYDGAVVLEPNSRVIGGPGRVAPSAFTGGRTAERLFWRSLSAGAALPALAGHGMEVLRHAVAAAPLGTLPMLLGRLVGLMQFGDHAAGRRRLAAVHREIEAVAAARTLRIDAAHERLAGPQGRVSAVPLKRSA